MDGRRRGSAGVAGAAGGYLAGGGGLVSQRDSCALPSSASRAASTSRLGNKRRCLACIIILACAYDVGVLRDFPLR
jgi:hypothetical protein